MDDPSPPAVSHSKKACPVEGAPVLALPQPFSAPDFIETKTETLTSTHPPHNNSLPLSSSSLISEATNASPPKEISKASSPDMSSTQKTPSVPSGNHFTPTVSNLSPSPQPTTASATPANPAVTPPTTSPSTPASISSPSTNVGPSKPPKALPKRPTFAVLAKKVIIQERLRKAEEEDTIADDEDEEPEEDLSLEQLEEKAKGGDARAQTRMGQHHLILAEEKDTDLNNYLAVNWLINAAKQGRTSAARILQRCWIQNKGITPENEAAVRKLSTESRFEQTVRKAARMMFLKLNPDRKNKMDMAEMLENASHINNVEAGGGSTGLRSPTSNQTQKVLESMVINESNQMVDLEDFVEITQKYAQGITPSVSRESSVDEPQTKTSILSNGTQTSEVHPAGSRRSSRSSWSLGRGGMMLANKRSGAMKKAMDIKSHLMVLQYPVQSILEMKDHIVDWSSRAGVQWLSTAIPTHHVNALIFFFIISNLTVDLFAFVIPLLVFYLSFISMMICTLRIFQSSKRWENFSTLTALLTRFEPGLDVEQAETNFGWNHLEQYLYFLFSVFFGIFSFPVADKSWIPCSELSTVTMFFTAISYMSLSPMASTYARKAMIIEVASSVCSLARFLPQTTKALKVLRLLGCTFATVPLGESVVLKLSLPCLLYIYLFYLFFRMAKMRGFRGTYCFLIPYLVCFMWCEFSMVLLQNSSPLGLIRTCVAYFLFLFALPVLAFGLAALFLIQVIKWFLELELTKVIVTLAVCAIPVTLRLWTRFSMSILDVFHSLKQSGPVKIILFCISMVILLFSLYLYNSEGLKIYNSTLTWKQYGQHCGPPAWQTKGMAQTQLFCSHLDGHRVTWTGQFKHVRVAETENGAQSLIKMLPLFMADWLRCLYGEKYPKCEPRNTPVANLTSNITASSMPDPVPLPIILQMQEEEELCQLKALAKHTCHVKRFDSYRFEVTVGMIPDEGMADPGCDIMLMASHEFMQVLFNLDPGNTVEFSTKLGGRLGAKAPAFELKAMHCLDCVSTLMGGRQVKIEREWRETTQGAFKFAFDFFFSPFLTARIEQ